jgi:hypothetical protein
MSAFKLAVVTGHFAASARARDIGCRVSDRQFGTATRRATVRPRTGTEAGTAVLPEARSVSVGVDNLRAKVKRPAGQAGRRDRSCG